MLDDGASLKISIINTIFSFRNNTSLGNTNITFDMLVPAFEWQTSGGQAAGFRTVENIGGRAC